MAVRAPNLSPVEDSSIHDDDLTHPRGNKELAEKMAHSQLPYEKEARWREGYAKASRVFEIGNEKEILSKSEEARRKGERQAELERQVFLEEHPELMHATRRIIGEQGARLKLVPEPSENATTTDGEIIEHS